MIGPSGTTQIVVATKPVDFRKQADSLAALVQQALGADPFSGTVYVFRAKRADRVKLVWWDGTGLCLLSKRLEGGQFRWPRIKDGDRVGIGEPFEPAGNLDTRLRPRPARHAIVEAALDDPVMELEDEGTDKVPHIRRCRGLEEQAACLRLPVRKEHEEVRAHPAS
jgi:transposase